MRDEDGWKNDPQQRYDRLYGRKKWCPHGLANHQRCRDCIREHPYSCETQAKKKTASQSKPSQSKPPQSKPPYPETPDTSQGSATPPRVRREVPRGKWGDLHSATNLKDLKKSYKSLAKTYHPDKGGSTEEFQDLLWMYERLSQKFE